MTLENVTSERSRYGVYIVGLDSTVNVSDVTLKNCSFNGVEQGASITGAGKVRFRKVFVNGMKEGS